MKIEKTGKEGRTNWADLHKQKSLLIEQAINNPEEFIKWAKLFHDNCELGSCEIKRDLYKYNQGIIGVADFFYHTKDIEEDFYVSFDHHLNKS